MDEVVCVLSSERSGVSETRECVGKKTGPKPVLRRIVLEFGAQPSAAAPEMISVSSVVI